MRIILAALILAASSAQAADLDFSRVTCSEYLAALEAANSGTLGALPGAMKILFLNGFVLGAAAQASQSADLLDLLARVSGGDLPAFGGALSVCEAAPPEADFYATALDALEAALE